MDRAALSKYFEATATKPAALGGLDCVRFVIDALYVGWRVDYRDILGYQDRRTAIDRLRIAGGLEAAFTAELGDPIEAEELSPGDIAFFNDPAIGLVMPGYVAVKFHRTIGRVPLYCAAKGWRSWVQ